MATFKEKLQEAGGGKHPTPKSLTFLSDPSMEDRTILREIWPGFPVERRRTIIEMLVSMAEDNVDFYFRPVFAVGRNIDPRWEQIVLKELESDLAPMRYEAARAAGEMAFEDALPLLVKLVDDHDLQVRLAAVWALGQIGGKPAAEALARALK